MLRFFALAIVLAIGSAAVADDAPLVAVGVAKVDITPTEPIRLSGYGFRRTPHEGVIHPIWAKAVSIGDDASGPAVWLMVDATCIPERDRRVARRSASSSLTSSRFVTHTHRADGGRRVVTVRRSDAAGTRSRGSTLHRN
jgi:hypothetical protein